MTNERSGPVGTTTNAGWNAGWWMASDGNWYPPEQRPGTGHGVVAPTVVAPGHQFSSPGVVTSHPASAAPASPQLGGTVPRAMSPATRNKVAAVIAAVVIVLGVGAVGLFAMVSNVLAGGAITADSPCSDYIQVSSVDDRNAIAERIGQDLGESGWTHFRLDNKCLLQPLSSIREVTD